MTHLTWVRCLRHTGIPTFATKPLAWMTCIGPGNFFHNGCPVRDPRLNIRLAKHCIYNISPSYEEDNSPPPTIHHNTAIHARNCTLLLSKINIWNIVYSSVLKRNKKLDRPRVAKLKKKGGRGVLTRSQARRQNIVV